MEKEDTNNRIGHLNNEDERRVWIAAFECKCRLVTGPRDIDYARDSADSAVLEYRKRAQ